MSTNYICFSPEMRKILSGYQLLSGAMNYLFATVNMPMNLNG